MPAASAVAGFPQEGQPSADFFDIVAWRTTADFVGKYFKKGMQVLVEGNLRNNSWQDQQGNKRTRTEVHAESVFFADSKRDSNAPSYTSNAPSFANNAPAPSAPQQPKVNQPENGDGYYAFNGDDEDLPF